MVPAAVITLTDEELARSRFEHAIFTAKHVYWVPAVVVCTLRLLGWLSRPVTVPSGLRVWWAIPEYQAQVDAQLVEYVLPIIPAELE